MFIFFETLTLKNSCFGYTLKVQRPKEEIMNSVNSWSKTLLTTYNYIPKAIRSAEVKITNYPFTQDALIQDALSVCKTIQQLTDNKNALINAKVIVDGIMEELPRIYRDFLQARYICRNTIDTIVDLLKISRATAFRREKEALAAFSSVLMEKYNGSDHFGKTYINHPFLGEAYRIICESDRLSS